MLTALKLLSVAIAFLDVRISTLNEETIEGTLIRIDDSQAVVSKDSKETVIPLSDIVEASFNADPESPADDFHETLELLDSSSLAVTDISATADHVLAGSESLGDLKIPRQAFRAITLQEIKPDWKVEWEAYLQRDNKKDMVIVPKRDGNGLDFIPGVIVSIGPEKIPFLLQGEEIPVPRERVVGLIFAATEVEDAGLDGDVGVTLRDKTTVRVSSIEIIGDDTTVQTSWGQPLTAPTQNLKTIDYSGGRIHHLSALEPITEVYFGLDPPEKSWGPLFEDDESTRTGLSRQWKMSQDRFPNSGRPPLTLRGKAYSKGLCIFPSAKVEYALDGNYTGLTALIGVDDEVAFNQLEGKPSTAVELRIEADGNEIYRQLITATADPVNINLDLTDITTLSLYVDFGDGNSTCDYLDIVNPRLFVDTSKN